MPVSAVTSVYDAAVIPDARCEALVEPFCRRRTVYVTPGVVLAVQEIKNAEPVHEAVRPEGGATVSGVVALATVLYGEVTFKLSVWQTRYQ